MQRLAARPGRTAKNNPRRLRRAEEDPIPWQLLIKPHQQMGLNSSLNFRGISYGWYKDNDGCFGILHLLLLL